VSPIETTNLFRGKLQRDNLAPDAQTVRGFLIMKVINCVSPQDVIYYNVTSKLLNENYIP